MKRISNMVLMIICCLIIGSCANNKTICMDEWHPHLIDLGLPNGTKWACCNVGANSPEDIGGYYAWGETEVKSEYDDHNYRHGELSYKNPQRMGNIAGSKYDVAHVRMGSSYAMPTSEQWHELIDYCTWKCVKYKGQVGWDVQGPNGNHIFLPLGGMKADIVYDKDQHGYYWTSEYNHHDELPCSFATNGGSRDVRSTISYSTSGFNVRAVGAN